MKKIENKSGKVLERRVGDVPYVVKQGVSEFEDEVASILVRSFAHVGVRFVPEKAVPAEVREAGKVLAKEAKKTAKAERKAEKKGDAGEGTVSTRQASAAVLDAQGAVPVEPQASGAVLDATDGGEAVSQEGEVLPQASAAVLDKP